MREISPVTGRPYRRKVDGSVDGRARQCKDGTCKCGFVGPVITSKKYSGTFCRTCYEKIKFVTYRDKKGVDSYRAMIRDWASNNKDRQRIYEKRYYTKLRQENPKKLSAKSTAWKKLLRKATPKWLSRAERKEIQKFYENRPEGYHVDHIIPIRGKSVSGLHVLWNLQYLPAEENMKKGNRV